MSDRSLLMCYVRVSNARLFLAVPLNVLRSAYHNTSSDKNRVFDTKNIPISNVCEFYFGIVSLGIRTSLVSNQLGGMIDIHSG